MIDEASAQALLGSWWYNYDEGNFAALKELLTDDVRFTCRTDTGATDYEDFVRADVSGRDGVIAWNTRHRHGSPYPLRHNATNVHLVEHRGSEASFVSYIFVTHITEAGVTNLSSGHCTGAVRNDDDGAFDGLEGPLDRRHARRTAQLVGLQRRHADDIAHERRLVRRSPPSKDA